MSPNADNFIRQLASDPALKGVLEPIALALELIGVAIIVYGAIVTAVFLVRKEKQSVRQAGRSQYRIKQQFTTRILTGLEFFIAGGRHKDHNQSDSGIAGSGRGNRCHKGGPDIPAQQGAERRKGARKAVRQR